MSLRLLGNSSLLRQPSLTYKNLTKLCLNSTRNLSFNSPSSLTQSSCKSVKLDSSYLFRQQQQQYQRTYSVLSTNSIAKTYKYEEVKDLISSEHPDQILVDVREPSEYEEGFIPSAINLPFKSSPGALDMSPEKFKDSFGFEKPSKDKELIFYCLGGVRSTAAEELANTFGYEKRGNYVGSWEDWVSHENDTKAKL